MYALQWLEIGGTRTVVTGMGGNAGTKGAMGDMLPGVTAAHLQLSRRLPLGHMPALACRCRLLIGPRALRFDYPL